MCVIGVMASEIVQEDPKFSLRKLAHAKIRSELDQSWWMYPIARFFGHALYGKNVYNCITEFSKFRCIDFAL